MFNEIDRQMRDVNSDPAAFQFLRSLDRGSTSAKRIKHYAALVT